MSSLHSDDLQSLHGIASDSGYTSAASTACKPFTPSRRAHSALAQALAPSVAKSRKRAPSLTSLRSSRSRSTSSNRRASSLNAKSDRLNSSMNDVAAASATSAGADPSLGVKRKTIAQSAEGTRGSVQGSAPVRRNDLGEEEVEEGSWREDEAGERERRKKRRMNEAISGPGSSLGAVGEAFRLLSWEGRRGSREAAGEGEARSTKGYDQHDHVQLDRVPSPSGSGRVRTLARDAGWGPSQRDRSPPPMALPPWMVNEKVSKLCLLTLTGLSTHPLPCSPRLHLGRTHLLRNGSLASWPPQRLAVRHHHRIFLLALTTVPLSQTTYHPTTDPIPSPPRRLSIGTSPTHNHLPTLSRPPSRLHHSRLAVVWTLPPLEQDRATGLLRSSRFTRLSSLERARRRMFGERRARLSLR